LHKPQLLVRTVRAAGVLFELLTGVLSVLIWLLGWPGLSTLLQALNVVGVVLVAVALTFGILLLVCIVQSQLGPSYEDRTRDGNGTE
jgi:hypothetical protein